MLWLIGMVLCGGRCFVLQVDRVCAKMSVCAHAAASGLETEPCHTCSYYLWSRHSSSCVVVHAGVVMFVVVKGPPRGWGAAQSMRGTASTGRRRRPDGGGRQCSRRGRNMCVQ